MKIIYYLITDIINNMCNMRYFGSESAVAEIANCRFGLESPVPLEPRKLQFPTVQDVARFGRTSPPVRRYIMEI